MRYRKLMAGCLAVLALLAMQAAPAVALPVNQIDYNTIGGTGLITFDDVAGGGAPGTNDDAIFESNGADFGERFVGQVNTPSGNFDVLSGAPSGSLALAVGAAGQNLNVVVNGGTQVLAGLGPLGFPSFDAIGEGAFAVLFDFDQSEFGFQLVGGNGGNAFVSFFKRDGSLISTITLTGLADASYGFQREGNVKDIAGISVHNNDLAGVGFDNLKHDVEGVPGPPSVPEPATLFLLGIGLATLAVWRRAS
jgi:hypothetical protein